MRGAARSLALAALVVSVLCVSGEAHAAAQRRYDAWGNYTSTPPSALTPGYTGHLWDANSGLVYGKARWYAPELGRWLSEDPVGPDGRLETPNALNAWAYADENPLRYTDPDGRSAAEILRVAEEFARGLREAVNTDIEDLTYRSAILEATESRWLAGFGKIIGFNTKVNGIYKSFRIDFDPIKGPHINVMIGKGSNRQTYAITWKGTETDVAKIIRSWNK